MTDQLQLPIPSLQKPGWLYIDGQNIHQIVALHLDSGWIQCSDGVKYSPSEMDLLDEFPGKITPEIHRVKKVFDGTIVKFEQRMKGHERV